MYDSHRNDSYRHTIEKQTEGITLHAKLLSLIRNEQGNEMVIAKHISFYVDENQVDASHIDIIHIAICRYGYSPCYDVVFSM